MDWERGEAIQMTPADSRHGFFIQKPCAHLDTHLQTTQPGRAWVDVFVDFVGVTYGADLVVLFPDHYDRHQKGRFQGAPDLVVEVISEDSVARDRTVKMEAYHQNGVPWYWIGDPAAGTLEEFRHTPEGYLRTAAGSMDAAFRPQALPGLEVLLPTLIEPA